ncbi:MAG: class I SAM-dependent methyltransferase [Dehalococcoidia bacterium]|nr:class I SAM-dependent methyltransferase [Dehalococcoidia bacterium]
MTTPPQGSQWYVDFFKQDYLDIYTDAPNRSFTPERAIQESAFVEKALGLRPGADVLDLCCGQGRHSVLLAKRGFRVTGLDLSQELLDLARRAAAAERVSLELVRADMREIPFSGRFDNVINMFTAFGYLESEDEDKKVLAAVHKTLKPGGRLLMDMINREWVVANYAEHDWHRGDDGTLYVERRDLDLATSRNRVTFTIVPPQGPQRQSGHDIRLYTLTEMTRLLREAGLRLTATYGGFDGAPYSVFTRRMILVAEKA